jgi:hypothetical protein
VNVLDDLSITEVTLMLLLNPSIYLFSVKRMRMIKSVGQKLFTPVVADCPLFDVNLLQPTFRELALLKYSGGLLLLK